MRRTLAAIVLLFASLPAAAWAEPPTVAVAPFANATDQPDYKPIATTVTEMLTLVLAESEAFNVVERHRLDAVLQEQGLASLKADDRQRAVRLGRLLEVDRLVSGSVLRSPEQGDKPRKLSIVCHAWHIQDGRLIDSVRATGGVNNLKALGTEAAQKLLKTLGAPAGSVTPNQLTAHPRAELNTLRGLGFYHLGQYDRALLAFTRAWQLQPDRYRTLLWQARCYQALDEPRHAIVAARQLHRQARQPAMRRQGQALIEAMRKRIDGPIAQAPDRRDEPEPAFPHKAVFAGQPQGERPTLALLATPAFEAAEPVDFIAKLIRQRLGAEVMVLPEAMAPESAPLDGRQVASDAKALLQKAKQRHPDVDCLLVLTDASLGTQRWRHVRLRRWPEAGPPRVVVASTLWLAAEPPLHPRPADDAPPNFAQKPRTYNFYLASAAQLLGRGSCNSRGCPANRVWYSTDRRFYKAWFCKRCRQRLREPKAGPDVEDTP